MQIKSLPEVHANQKEAQHSLDIAKDEISILETVTETLRGELGRMKQEYSENHMELEKQLKMEQDGKNHYIHLKLHTWSSRSSSRWNRMVRIIIFI
jgi:hypothetical protein